MTTKPNIERISKEESLSEEADVDVDFEVFCARCGALVFIEGCVDPLPTRGIDSVEVGKW